MRSCTRFPSKRSKAHRLTKAAIKSILGDDAVQNELAPAFEKYNEEQFSLVKLPGGNTEVLVSPYNSLGDGRYYDTENNTSFAYDHASLSGTASDVRSYTLESNHEDLVYDAPPRHLLHSNEAK